MLHARVQIFDVTGTVEIFLQTKHPHCLYNKGGLRRWGACSGQLTWPLQGPLSLFVSRDLRRIYMLMLLTYLPTDR